jgi:hypothetical protein
MMNMRMMKMMMMMCVMAYMCEKQKNDHLAEVVVVGLAPQGAVAGLGRLTPSLGHPRPNDIYTIRKYDQHIHNIQKNGQHLQKHMETSPNKVVTFVKPKCNNHQTMYTSSKHM